jgi:hypothetical protein
MAAVKLIKFVPATKDGHAVSMYMQIEFGFNLVDDEPPATKTTDAAPSSPETKKPEV